MENPPQKDSGKLLAGVFFLYLSVSLLWTYPSFLNPAHTLPSGPESDASQALWAIEHYEFFGSKYDHRAYPPKGVDFSYIHWMAVPLLVSQALASLFGTIGAYNLVVWLSLATGALGAYCLARREGLSSEAAWTAGLSYGFCPYLAGQLMLGHFFYLFGAALVPFYLLAFSHFLKGPKRRMWGLATVILWLLLMRSCIYYCLFLVPVCFVWGAVFVLKSERASLKPLFGLLGLGIGASFLGLAQSQASSDTALFMPRANVEIYDADLLALVTPSPYHPLWGEHFSRSGDRVGFLGFALLALLLWQLSKGKHLRLVLLGGVCWLIALGPVAYWAGQRMGAYPWASLFSLPGYSGIQVLARALLITQLFLVIAACGAISSRRQAGILSAIVLFEFCLTPAVYDNTEALLFTKLQDRPPGAVGSIPYEPQNTQPLYHHNLHQQSGLRAPVLRPTPALVSFYEQFAWVRAFGQRSGYQGLTPPGALELQTLTNLRYLALDTSRLDAEQIKGWEETITSTFPIVDRLSNQRFHIFQLGELPGRLAQITIHFDQKDQNYCGSGLSPAVSKGGRRIVGSEVNIWLPLSDPSPRYLELVGLLEGSATGQVFWNDEEIGTMFWSKGDSHLRLPLPADLIEQGANKLTLRFTPSSSQVSLTHLRVMENP